MRQALSETPVGRALLSFWYDMPLWVIGNVLLAASIAVSVRAALSNQPWVALITSFPGVFVLAGLSNAAALVAQESTPHWRDLLKGPHRVLLLLWGVLVLLVRTLLFPLPVFVFGALCMVTAAVLLLAPFMLSVSALHRVSLLHSWRNGLVLAVHYPSVALGLLVLAGMGSWLIVTSHGSAILIVPALWINIAVFSTHAVIQNCGGQEVDPGGFDAGIR